MLTATKKKKDNFKIYASESYSLNISTSKQGHEVNIFPQTTMISQFLN